MKYRVGYTQGVYDMFHVGHLNLLLHAKELCEYLIVGINSDDLVREYKRKSPVINETDRARIVSNIKAVDECRIVTTLDKMQIRKQIPFDVIFIGDDWKGNPRWEKTSVDMKRAGIDVVFLPHTVNVSSTFLREKERRAIKE